MLQLRSLRSLPFLAVSSGALLFAAACSEDSAPAVSATPTGSAGAGGRTLQGGAAGEAASGTGGSSGRGGAGTGGAGTGGAGTGGAGTGGAGTGGAGGAAAGAAGAQAGGASGTAGNGGATQAGSGGTAGNGGSAGNGQAGGGGAAGLAGAAGAGGSDPAVCDAATRQAYTSGLGEGTPPAAPTGAPVGDGEPIAFAVSDFYLGDTTFDDKESPNAWSTIGLNLDGFTSDKGFGCHCKAVEKSATNDIRTDGVDGIDNTFGGTLIAQSLLPISGASESATAGIAEGRSSLVLSFANLGTATDYASVSAELVPVRMPAGMVPKRDGTDVWSPLSGDTLPAVSYPGGWVNADTWVSPPSSSTLFLQIELGDSSLRLPIQKARITAKLSSDRKRIERGIVAGTVEVEAFAAAFRSTFESLGVCGAALDSVLPVVRSIADSPNVGEHDPNVTCNAISVGIGFKASRIANLGTPLAPEPTVSACTP